LDPDAPLPFVADLDLARWLQRQQGAQIPFVADPDLAPW
jgi:hypothetical protein